MKIIDREIAKILHIFRPPSASSPSARRSSGVAASRSNQKPPASSTCASSAGGAGLAGGVAASVPRRIQDVRRWISDHSYVTLTSRTDELLSFLSLKPML